jgi:hypothetical protein
MRRCLLCNTGRVTVGYYILRDGVLTMTDDEGAPVRGQSGEKIKIQQKLKDGEDATVIAKRLTMKIYRMRNGDKSDFQSTIGLSKSRISLMDVGT